MATHHQLYTTNTYYFITFTCYKWLSLLDETNMYDYIPIWFDNLNKHGVKVSAYVIMPNHIHLIVFVDENCENPNKVIGNAKRFLAYKIIDRLYNDNKTEILEQLKAGVAKNEAKKGKKHQVFRLSFDAKELTSLASTFKVLDYIHKNPVSGKWNLVENYLDYKYSSARHYELGEECVVELFDCREY